MIYKSYKLNKYEIPYMNNNILICINMYLIISNNL